MIYNLVKPYLAGSNPAPATNFPQQNTSFAKPRTPSAHISQRKSVKFPLKIDKRGFSAKIYGKTESTPYYRVVWKSYGKRRSQQFKKLADARKHADKVLKDLSVGSSVSSLTTKQSQDAIAAVEMLQSLCERSGQRYSIHAAISEFVEAKLVTSEPLNQVAVRYKDTVASLTEIDLDDALDKFIGPKKKSRHANQQYNRLRKFAAGYHNYKLSGITRDILENFFNNMSHLGARTRNHYRSDLRDFFKWATRNDHLPQTQRLTQCDALRSEVLDAPDIKLMSPGDFDKLLDACRGDRIHPCLAIAGLAGVRWAEVTRLEWADVFRHDNCIEISGSKAKTRSRRLIPINDKLREALKPYEGLSGRLWQISQKRLEKLTKDLYKRVGVEHPHNVLRHSFVSYHYALHNDERATASCAGHDPATLHRNYKGLATKEDAEAWFA